MAKYHVNYEGKILPCRAKVKRCPYDEERHGDSYEELYTKVMATYNNTPVNEELAEKLNTGATIGSLACISDQLETSKAPMETMIATLDLARQNVGAGNMPKNLVSKEEKGIQTCMKLYELGDDSVPSNVPKHIREEARSRWVERGRPLKKVDPYAGVASERRMYYNELADMNEDLQETKQWRDTHVVYSDEFNRDYKRSLDNDFYNYSKALNTSKQLTQPQWAYNKSKEEVSQILQTMNNVELLSLYDDLTVSEAEIDKNVANVNGFNYNRRTDISDKANDNIERWYNRNKELYKKEKERRADRLFLSFFVARELSDRNIQFGG